MNKVFLRELKILIIVIVVPSLLLVAYFSISAYSQEAKYDRIFNTPQYNNTQYITMYNGTVYEITNMRQIVFYYWSDLSENAKRLVNQTMVLNGYTESERSLHFD